MQGSVTAILIGLSVLRYVPSQPEYQKKIGDAAFVQSGMNQTVDQATRAIETKARYTIRQVGIPDRAVAGVLITLKVVRDREVSVSGPKIVSAGTHLTAGLDHGTLGITWRF